MTRFSLLLLALLTLSCGVQKRHYMRGYYVGHSFHAKNQSKGTKTIPGLSNLNKAEKVKDPVILCEAGKFSVPATKTKLRPLLQTKQKPRVYLPPDTCDLLLFKDGTKMLVRIFESSSTDIKFKRCDSPDGPSYVTLKQDLSSINYANGTREVIQEAATPEIPETDTRKEENEQAESARRPEELENSLARVSWLSGIISIASMALETIVLIIGTASTPYAGTFLAVLIISLGLISVIASIVGTITGSMALKEIKNDPDIYTASSKRLAMRGLRMSMEMLILWSLSLLFALGGA